MNLRALAVFAVVLSVHPICHATQQGKDAEKGCTSQVEGKEFPTQANFKVPTTKVGRPVAPVLATARDRLYRSSIREAMKKGPNFAGHYLIAHWGCGTGCLGFAIVDMSTGKIYDTTFSDVDHHFPSNPDGTPQWWCYSNPLTYDLGSRLLIIEGCLDGKQCGRTYLTMESEGLRQIEYDPDLLKDGTIAPF